MALRQGRLARSKTKNSERFSLAMTYTGKQIHW
jgi:hypothetical protein